MQNQRIDNSKLVKKILLFVPLGILIVGLMLFLPAGSLGYWQAWLFMGTLFLPFFVVVFYFLKHDPEFLVRRLKFKEKEAKEKSIIKIAQLLFLIAFLVPGIDYRLGWSHVPSWLVITADFVIFISYMFVFYVFKVNSYASRIVEVEKGQKLITAGPYSVIRHPMYAGIIPLYLCVPLALGSYFALIPIVPILIVIVLRIFDEEKVLLRDLKGYKEYTKRVKYRLIPYVW